MIGFLAFGLVVGWLARLFKSGRHPMKLWQTLALGALGSIVGGTIANWLGTGSILELNVIGSIAAIVSAMVLLGIVDRVQSSR